MIKKIVVPVDHTEDAKKTLNIAVWLSLLFEAKLVLLGICDRGPKTIRQVHPAHGEITPSKSPEEFRGKFEGLWNYPLYFPQAPIVPVETVSLVSFGSDEEQDLELYLSNLQKEVTGSHLHHKLPPGRVSWRIEKGPLDQALKNLDAEEPVDLVVLAVHRETGLKQHFISSQPNQILRQAQLPTLVVPQGFKVSTLRQFENETVLVSLNFFQKPTKGHIVVTLLALLFSSRVSFLCCSFLPETC